MKVTAKYIGDSYASFEKDKLYDAVGFDPEENLVSVVDESNEDYLYSPDMFEFEGDYTNLPKVSMFI